MKKMINFNFNMLIICMWLQVINVIKVTHQGEYHIKVKVRMSTFQFYVIYFVNVFT